MNPIIRLLQDTRTAIEDSQRADQERLAELEAEHLGDTTLAHLARLRCAMRDAALATLPKQEGGDNWRRTNAGSATIRPRLPYGFQDQGTSTLQETLPPLQLPDGAKVAGWRVQGTILHVLVTGPREDDPATRAVIEAAVGDTYSHIVIN